MQMQAEKGKNCALPNTNIFIHHCTYNVSDQQPQNLYCQKQIWSSSTLAAHGNCSDKRWSYTDFQSFVHKLHTLVWRMESTMICDSCDSITMFNVLLYNMIPKTYRNKQITWTLCVCMLERERETQRDRFVILWCALLHSLLSWSFKSYVIHFLCWSSVEIVV
jgi:hypothetical protein